MNLHTCPHCQTPALYSPGVNALVNCRSCGAQFPLSRFNSTTKDRLTRWALMLQLKAKSARSSRRLLVVGSAFLGLVVVWLGLSLFGLLPDEFRALNRRFVSVENENELVESVGLVAIGKRLENGDVEFNQYFTAAAISDDGFMLTAGSVLNNPLNNEMWVFINGTRFDAVPIGVDSIRNIGIIKVEGNLQHYFRVMSRGTKLRLNVNLVSVGFPRDYNSVDPPINQSFSLSSGTLSRIFSDTVGTEWIEHDAVLSLAGVGGPVVMNDRIIGINIESTGPIVKAVSIVPLYSTITRIIRTWNAHQDEK